MAEDIQADGPAPRRRRDEEIRDDEDRPRQRSRRSRDEEEDDRDLERIRQPDEGVNTLIPYRNPSALISYYCGVFSLIPCVGAILGPTAIILGLVGLSYKKKHPTAGGTAHAIVGIVLGALTTLAHVAVVALGVGGAMFS